MKIERKKKINCELCSKWMGDDYYTLGGFDNRRSISESSMSTAKKLNAMRRAFFQDGKVIMFAGDSYIIDEKNPR